ncbi:uncharacterized protein C2845_PM03G33080 [Panicum miliaceum]|uniref:Uncharacterized protein n=1 Tax=Panicum miliaceum TaxID=4540 RepID=A0A3L6TF60_PANMI|nr:uncharacterized protein C2845_PM03G33080 [Panicum miliaceum]
MTAAADQSVGVTSQDPAAALDSSAPTPDAGIDVLSQADAAASQGTEGRVVIDEAIRSPWTVAPMVEMSSSLAVATLPSTSRAREPSPCLAWHGGDLTLMGSSGSLTDVLPAMSNALEVVEWGDLRNGVASAPSALRDVVAPLSEALEQRHQTRYAEDAREREILAGEFDALKDEETKSQQLSTELDLVKELLELKEIEVTNLQIAARMALEDLGGPATTEDDKLISQLNHSAKGAQNTVNQALHLGVRRAFAVAYSHYVDIDLPELSQGFASGYEEEDLEQIENDIAPLTRALAEKMEDEVVLKK